MAKVAKEGVCPTAHTSPLRLDTSEEPPAEYPVFGPKYPLVGPGSVDQVCPS